MIWHIVMWKVRGDTLTARQANIERVRRGFLGPRGRIPGLLHPEIGVDSSGVDYTRDVVLVSDFEFAALVGYAVHPEHLGLRNELAGVRIERHQVDYVVVAEASVGTSLP